MHPLQPFPFNLQECRFELTTRTKHQVRDSTSLTLLAFFGHLHGGMLQHWQPVAPRMEIPSLRQHHAKMMSISDALYLSILVIQTLSPYRAQQLLGAAQVTVTWLVAVLGVQKPREAVTIPNP